METKQSTEEIKTTGETTPTREDGGNDAPVKDLGSNDQRAQASVEAAQKEMLYLRAEMENYKRRMLKEQEQAIRFANEKLIKDLLGIADYFDLAFAHAKPIKARTGDPELTNFVSGIEMTQRELVQLLGRFGVEFIGTVGEKFDPVRHEAISQKESATEDAGTVLEVLQKGSLLHGRLLKPARVVVAKKHEA